MEDKPLGFNEFLREMRGSPMIWESVQAYSRIYEKEEAFLHRFFVASTSSTKIAFERVEKHLNWFESAYPEYLSRTTASEVLHVDNSVDIDRCLGLYYVTETEQYKLVIYLNFEEIKLESVLNYLDREDYLLHYALYFLQSVFKHWTHVKKLTNLERSVVLIVELEGFSSSKLTVPFLRFIRKLMVYFQTYFPEVLREIFLLNAPEAFYSFWTLVKDLLDARTIEKTTFYKGQLADLLEHLNLVDWIPNEECLLGSRLALWNKNTKQLETNLMNFNSECDFQIAIQGQIPKLVRYLLHSSCNDNVDDVQRITASIHDFLNYEEKRMLEQNQELRVLVERLELQKQLVLESLRLPGGMNSKRDSETMKQLEKQLEVALEDAAAYKRTIEFAKNFIEIEAAKSKDLESRIIERIQSLKSRNQKLRLALKGY